MPYSIASALSISTSKWQVQLLFCPELCHEFVQWRRSMTPRHLGGLVFADGPHFPQRYRQICRQGLPHEVGSIAPGVNKGQMASV
jgi:hypothetical protein